MERAPAQPTCALKRWFNRAAMMAGGCCLAMRMCRLSSCALSRPLAVLFLRVQLRHSTMHSFVGNLQGDVGQCSHAGSAPAHGLGPLPPCSCSCKAESGSGISNIHLPEPHMRMTLQSPALQLILYCAVYKSHQQGAHCCTLRTSGRDMGHWQWKSTPKGSRVSTDIAPVTPGTGIKLPKACANLQK